MNPSRGGCRDSTLPSFELDSESRLNSFLIINLLFLDEKHASRVLRRSTFECYSIRSASGDNGNTGAASDAGGRCPPGRGTRSVFFRHSPVVAKVTGSATGDMATPVLSGC